MKVRLTGELIRKIVTFGSNPMLAEIEVEAVDALSQCGVGDTNEEIKFAEYLDRHFYLVPKQEKEYCKCKFANRTLTELRLNICGECRKPIHPSVSQEKECQCVYSGEPHGIEFIKSPSGEQWAVGGTDTMDRWKFCPWCGGSIPKEVFRRQPPKVYPVELPTKFIIGLQTPNEAERIVINALLDAVGQLQKMGER